MKNIAIQEEATKMLSAKWRPFCYGLNVLTWIYHMRVYAPDCNVFRVLTEFQSHLEAFIRDTITSIPSHPIERCFLLYWHSPMASIHQTERRLTAISREVSKPRDLDLDFSNRSKIWQAPRQHSCRDACQMWQSDTIIITYNLATWDFTRFGGKTSYRLVNRSPGVRFTTDLYALYPGWYTPYNGITSNGSWRQGIKGEMTCTVYVALVWNIIYWIMMIIPLFTE